MKRSQSNFTKQYGFSYTDNVDQPSHQYASLSSTAKSHLRLVWPAQEAAISQKELYQIQLANIIAEARQNEKKLIGQELHDNVNQILSIVKLFIAMLNPSDARDKGIQEKTIEYVMQAISEIRKISGELVAPRQNEKGLIDNIRTIIEDIHFSTTIKIELSHSGNVECLSQDKKIALLRIVQEQFKNIIKYSKANHVSIDLHLRNNEIILSIADDGVGFDPLASRSGIGLSNIAERTQLYNGTVRLQTAKGKGCSLCVCIPAA